MSGVASETGSISPTIVAKIVIDNIMVTPEKNPLVNDGWKCKYVTAHTSRSLRSCPFMQLMIVFVLYTIVLVWIGRRQSIINNWVREYQHIQCQNQKFNTLVYLPYLEGKILFKKFTLETLSYLKYTRGKSTTHGYWTLTDIKQALFKKVLCCITVLPSSWHQIPLSHF